MLSHHDIAYFSLEIGLDHRIPTYSGGLGVLAGDTVRAAADLGLPFVGVTLLYRHGYFNQQLDDRGRQTETAYSWDPSELLEPLDCYVSLPIEGRDVYIRPWRLEVRGDTGRRVFVYFLDTDLPQNDPRDRSITHALYAGDQAWRLKQEAVLGIGGRRMVRALGHNPGVFHMNEGHAFLICIELLSAYLSREDTGKIDAEAIRFARERCVFTTHTPVEAGHDRFDINLVRRIVGDHPAFHRADLYGEPNGHGGFDGHTLNTTRVALNLSRYANAVAQKHGEVSRRMFPGYRIEAITNGVHAGSWTGPHMARVFDRHAPAWRRSNDDLRLVLGASDDEVRGAHAAAKRDFVAEIASRTGEAFSPDAFTIVFARRATAYKRPGLLLSDPDRLAALAEKHGPLQIIYGGKSHPHDTQGKASIERIHAAAGALGDKVRVVYLQNHEIDICKLMVAGCDVWLNNPEPPLEASGTSGMKAALNGVPSLSTLDGWWLEGCVDGVTGWAIGSAEDSVLSTDRDALRHKHAEDLYRTLDEKVLPAFYGGHGGSWATIMKHAIALNGSHFTTERMVREYVGRGYSGLERGGA